MRKPGMTTSVLDLRRGLPVEFVTVGLALFAKFTLLSLDQLRDTLPPCTRVTC
jgi:hypothetical protein